MPKKPWNRLKTDGEIEAEKRRRKKIREQRDFLRDNDIEGHEMSNEDIQYSRFEYKEGEEWPTADSANLGPGTYEFKTINTWCDKGCCRSVEIGIEKLTEKEEAQV